MPVAEAEREQHINRLGNLTLTVGPLNSAMSNDPWEAKRQELQKHSKLELNSKLVALDHFDERAIDERSEWLARDLDAVWPGPENSCWDA